MPVVTRTHEPIHRRLLASRRRCCRPLRLKRSAIGHDAYRSSGIPSRGVGSDCSYRSAPRCRRIDAVPTCRRRSAHASGVAHGSASGSIGTAPRDSSSLTSSTRPKRHAHPRGGTLQEFVLCFDKEIVKYYIEYLTMRDRHREFKDRLYGPVARLGKALSNPHRLEMLELLAQGAADC